MQKIRFLQNYGQFFKNTYRVVLNETDTHYIILAKTDGINEDTMELPKLLKGTIFEVIERID